MSKVSDCCDCNPHDQVYYGGHNPKCPLASKPCIIASKPENVLSKALNTINNLPVGKFVESQQPDASPDRLLTDERVRELCPELSLALDNGRIRPIELPILLQAQDAKTYPLAFEAGRVEERKTIALKLQEAMNAVPGKRLAKVENLLTDLFKEIK